MVRCQAFGLLLAWFGSYLHFCKQGSLWLGCLPYNRSNPSVHDLLDRSLNLRTIIVIADIYRGLYNPAQHINTLDPPYLTFRHRSGVTPYTSTFVFAGSCVFGKQSAGNLSLRPHTPEDVVAGLIPKLRPLFCRVP